jgi:hypothetical protein
MSSDMLQYFRCITFVSELCITMTNCQLARIFRFKSNLNRNDNIQVPVLHVSTLGWKQDILSVAHKSLSSVPVLGTNCSAVEPPAGSMRTSPEPDSSRPTRKTRMSMSESIKHKEECLICGRACTTRGNRSQLMTDRMHYGK